MARFYSGGDVVGPVAPPMSFTVRQRPAPSLAPRIAPIVLPVNPQRFPIDTPLPADRIPSPVLQSPSPSMSGFATDSGGIAAGPSVSVGIPGSPIQAPMQTPAGFDQSWILYAILGVAIVILLRG